MGRKAVMKAWAQDGSDVPKKIITKNTLGYKSPGSQEQTLEMKDKDEEAQIKTEKNKKNQGIVMIRARRRGGEVRRGLSVQFNWK